jgi:acetyl esterase
MELEAAVRAHLDALSAPAAVPHGVVAWRVFLRAEIDRIFRTFGLPGPQVAAIRDHRVPVDGAAEIVVRTYHPVFGAKLPCHVYMHGGGWNAGSIDDLVTDATARHRAVGAGCVVALVDYRLAPEHPFPTPVHDVVAAVRWLAANPYAAGIDPEMLTLGGNSAGANLAAAALVAAPDLPIDALVLEVPILDLTLGMATATCAELAAEHGADSQISELAAGAMADYERVRREYLEPDPWLDAVRPSAPFADIPAAKSPLASPVFADDLGGFPRTYVLTAQHDALRTEGALFADRLREDGARASVTCYPGALHGSPILTATWPTARRWQDDVIGILR